MKWTFLNFLGFYEKKPLQKGKGSQKLLRQTKKPWTYLKMLWKRNKNFKAIWVVLGHLKLKIFFVGQPWSTFFRDLGPLNCFSAATILSLDSIDNAVCDMFTILTRNCKLSLKIMDFVFGKALKSWILFSVISDCNLTVSRGFS